MENEEEDQSLTDLLRDRFRLSTVSVAQAEGLFLFPPAFLAKANDMEVSETVVACVADLSFKYAGEQLAKDLELFAQHAGHKSANIEDVILAGEFREPFCQNLRLLQHILATNR